MKFPLRLTAILVPDEKLGGFTAFFAQIPNVIAEGKNEDEAMKNLFGLLQSVFEYQQEEAPSQAQAQSRLSIQTRSYEFEARA